MPIKDALSTMFNRNMAKPHARAFRAAARPHRPVASRRVSCQARLFRIRSLHSEQGSVVLLDEEVATPLINNAPAESLPTPEPQPTPPEEPVKSPKASNPGSRSALMAAAGRKLIYATPKSITYLDGR